jgi:O-antigen/teichoic acid export membrane protein
MSTSVQPEHRRLSRHRRAAYTAAASTLARVTNLATTLITIRMTLSYLGTERFGLWMTISTLQIFSMFADLGIANGVLNAVAEANGRDANEEIHNYIDTGFLLLGSFSLLFLVGVAATYHWFRFADFFNLHSSLASREADPAMAVFLICVALDIPLGLVQRVQLGLQLGFLSSMWQMLGSLMAMAGVFAVIHMRGGVPLLVFVFCGAPVLARLMNGCFFFGGMQRHLLPTFRGASRSAIFRIGRLGGIFLVLNLAVWLAFQSDNLIIVHLLGPEAVTRYSVPQKLFTLIALGMSTLIEPLWPAYGEAMARRDGLWLRQTLVRSLVVTVTLSSVLVAIFVVLGPTLIHLWVGDKVHAGVWLLIGLACCTVVQSGGNAVNMFLNGTGTLRAQAILTTLFAAAAIVAKVQFVQRWGIEAVPWATFLCYLALMVLPYVIIVPGIAATLCKARPVET